MKYATESGQLNTPVHKPFIKQLQDYKQPNGRINRRCGQGEIQYRIDLYKQAWEAMTETELWIVCFSWRMVAYPLPLPLTGSTDLEAFPQLEQNPLKRHSWEKNKGFSCSSEWLNPAVECHYQTWLIFLQRWVMSEILSLQETLTSQTLVGQYTRGPRFPTVKGVYSTKRQGNSFQGRDPEE